MYYVLLVLCLFEQIKNQQISIDRFRYCNIIIQFKGCLRVYNIN